MVQQICIRISQTIHSVLHAETEIDDGVICNPTEYFNSIYRMLASTLAIVAHHNITVVAREADLNQLQVELENVLDATCLFVQKLKEANEVERQALSTFYNWFKSNEFSRVNLSDLYELILILEFPVRDGEITESIVGNELNSTGSFYTPIALADKCVSLTIDRYIEQNTGIERFSIQPKTEEQIKTVAELFTTSSFADQSCGTGSFLLSILRYAKINLGSAIDDLHSKIALNLFATEADPLAIEIARIEVATAINRFDLYSQIRQHFVHGNPLITPSEEIDAFDFSFEFYNHGGLGIEPNNIPSCDVIVGNPPWGTVSFDLPYYLHLTCPKILALETEDEVDQALEDLSFSHPNLYEFLLTHDEANDLTSEAIYDDERFQKSTMGGLQTNLLFTEFTDRLLTNRGAAGLILKGSTLSDSGNKRLWNHLANRNRVIARYDFINCNKIFNIDRTEEFSVLLLGQGNSEETSHLKGLTDFEQI